MAVDAVTVVLLVLVSSIFVMVEAAFLSVRRTRVDQLVEEGNRRARMAARLLAEPTRLLATLQVGLTLVQLFSAGEATSRFAGPFGDVLFARFPSWGSSTAHSVSFVIVIVAVALLTLVIGEVTPKSIAVQHAESIVLFFAYPLRWLHSVARPLVSLVTWLSTLLVRPLGGSVSFHTDAMTEEELKIMVEQSEEYGVIEREEKEMIHNVFEFADTIVRRVMTPRTEITAVEADASVSDLIAAVTESGHSRIPVYDDNLDNIVGIVHVKDILRLIGHDDGRVTIREVMREPYTIPDTKRVDDLLTDFKRTKNQIAVVRDEYGTVTGVVTIEDLVEEVFGDIEDEYDPDEGPLVRNLDERTAIVDGRMALDDFNDRMGADLPIGEIDTLGGFVFDLLGHQPEVGESAQWDGVEFSVEATDGKRIQKVRVVRSPELVDQQSDGGGTSGTAPVSDESSAESPSGPMAAHS